MLFLPWQLFPFPWHSQGNTNSEASYSTFCKGSAGPTSSPTDVPLTWFQRPLRTEVLQHSRQLFLVLINGNFSSVFTLHFPFSISEHLISTHNERVLCPLVECKKSWQAGNYENRYLWQVYHYPKQHYSTKLLEHETNSFSADLDFFPDVFIQKSGCSVVL